MWGVPKVACPVLSPASQALPLPGWPVLPLVGSSEPQPQLGISRACVALKFCDQALLRVMDTNAHHMFQ